MSCVFGVSTMFHFLLRELEKSNSVVQWEMRLNWLKGTKPQFCFQPKIIHLLFEVSNRKKKLDVVEFPIFYTLPKSYLLSCTTKGR